MINRDDDLRDLKDALEARAVELISDLLGPSKPYNKFRSNRNQKRWGDGGSFIYNCTGKMRGQWHSFKGEGKGHGNLLSLIQEYATGGDFVSAIKWARDWLGWGSGPAPEPRKSDKLRREREDRIAREAAEQEAKDNLKALKAQKIWSSAQSIKDTLGEVYLRDTRAINSASGIIWPQSIRWHDKHQAVVFAVTNAAGDVVALQEIAVTPEGKQDKQRIWNKNRPENKRAKNSVAAISRGAVQFYARSNAPINAPICIAEGPETGLSVWAATGYHTLITLGGIRRAADMIKLYPELAGKRIIICRDDDLKGSEALKGAKAAIRQLKADGFDAREAVPFEIRRGNKSDFNDLAQEEGLGAVKRRINIVALDEPILAQRLVGIEEARQRIDDRVGEFYDAVLASKEDETFAHAIGTSVGVGKTETALRHSLRCLKRLREREDKRAIVFALPEHRLSAEVAERFNAMAIKEGLTLHAEVWRGREAKLPNGQDDQRMCAEIETVREAQKLAVDIENEVCSVCPHKENCSYLGQRNLDADLWIVAHPMIFHKPPGPIKRRGISALVIDESPIQAGLIGIEGHGIELPIDALFNDYMPLPEGIDGERLADIRKRLGETLSKEPNGPLRCGALSDAYLDYNSAIDARRFEWRRKITDGAWREREDNRTLGKVNLLWRAVAALTEFGGPQYSGWLELDHNRDGARVVRITGRNEINDSWKVPTLLVDALLDIELAKYYWPRVENKGQFEVDAPYQTIRQAAGKSFAKRYLAPVLNDDDQDRSRSRARRNVKALILRRERELNGRTLVIANKSIAETLQLPPYIDVAHFNAVAGRDQWKDARLIVNVGRPMPSPRSVERMAAALTGSAPILADGWYDRADDYRLQRVKGGVVRVPTETDRHPDPICERLRKRICVGEIVQAIGRGRGVNRGPDDPVEVLILGDAVLPIPVDEFLPDEDMKPSPYDLMMAEGGIAFEGAASASLSYPGLWPNMQGAKKALQREHRGTKSYKNIPIGECPLVVFQKAGERRHSERAYYDPRRVADPRAALERLVGPLAVCEILSGVIAEAIEPAPSEALGLSETPELIVTTITPSNLIKCGKRTELAGNANEPIIIDWATVRARLRDSGLSHGELAERCGISQPQLSNIERGFRKATPQVAAALDVFLREAPIIQARLL